MIEFDSTILRERFTISYDSEGARAPIIALSNRVQISLKDKGEKTVESYIVRGQMLHSVVRFASTIMNSYDRLGPLLTRPDPVDWMDLWNTSAGNFERHHNSDLWASVYHKGKPIFEHGIRHSFLDVIEQCAQRVGRPYENAVMIAEGMFEQAGKNVTISHDNNIACTFQIDPDHGRVALVLRDAQKTRTFNFTGDKKSGAGRALNPVHFMNAGAAFLEGIQLAFTIGSGNEKLRQGLIVPGSGERARLESARARLGELNAAIRAFENLHDVRYRPERPEFSNLILNAEEITAKRLAADQPDEIPGA